MRRFITLLKHDIKLGFRNIFNIIYVIAFFFIVVLLFPFGVGTNSDLLKNAAGGIVWSAALLSFMLAVPKIYADDYEDGSMTQFTFLFPFLEIFVLARVISSWVIYGLPIVVATPLMLILLGASQVTLPMAYSLLVGTLIMSLIGSVAAALTLGVRRSAGLVSLAILPFFIPITIFGSLASNVEYQIFISNLGFLFLFLVVMIPVSLIATAASLRLAVEFE